VTADGKRTSRHVSWQPAFETSGLPVFRKTTTGTKPSDTKQQEGRKEEKEGPERHHCQKTQISKKKKKKGSKLKRKLGSHQKAENPKERENLPRLELSSSEICSRFSTDPSPDRPAPSAWHETLSCSS
jgi:hypothetical protein